MEKSGKLRCKDQRVIFQSSNEKQLLCSKKIFVSWVLNFVFIVRTVLLLPEVTMPRKKNSAVRNFFVYIVQTNTSVCQLSKENIGKETDDVDDPTAEPKDSSNQAQQLCLKKITGQKSSNLTTHVKTHYPRIARI